MSNSSVQRRLFQHEGVALCRFRCPADHDRWSHENTVVDGHNVAFAELPVEILPTDHSGLLADPNVAVFYNLGDSYRRRLNHREGDSANLFLFEAEHLLPALAPYESNPDPGRPLTIRFGHVRPGTYLKQRLLLARVSRGPAPDPCWVVEQAVEILDEVLATAYGEPRAPTRRRTHDLRAQRERVEEVKRLLFEHCEEALSLRTLAETVESSVFHLCRVFRRHTGQTIHGYRTRLRLRTGLVLLERTDTPLAQLALDVGFAHQSHFTEAFRREYGLPPGELRRRLNSVAPFSASRRSSPRAI
jgi:AraC-like DNA-binding protein